MALEDIAPKRSEIAQILREVANRDEFKGKGRDRTLPEEAKNALRAAQQAAVHSKLLEKFQNIPEEARNKILDDIDSYPESPKPPKRHMRQV